MSPEGRTAGGEVLSGGTRSVDAGAALPRLGFLGLGWIGRNRMEALAASGAARVAAVADPLAEAVEKAAEQAVAAAEAAGASAPTPPGETPRRTAVPPPRRARDLEGLLELAAEGLLDGLVIATPSALHAEQVEAACRHGLHVFCQKPLGRDAAEVERVLATARDHDRLLGVDYSYRHAEAMRRVRERAASGELGRIYAVRAVFHNAYGPDKAWFRQRELAGGGCAMDLGVHLVDFALGCLPGRRVERVEARCYAGGERLEPPVEGVEDYATALLGLEDGAAVELACSWNLPAGQDAVIEMDVWGTEGGARVRNVGGSFYDFTADTAGAGDQRTVRRSLAEPPDDWGGRALVHWARQLSTGTPGYDPEVESSLAVARVLDRIYGR